MDLSAEGAAFIARHEGKRNRPYNDALGHCTVGIGHLIHEGSCTPEEFRTVWTDEEIMRVFLEDIRRFVDGVNRHVRVRLTQAQFDALVSFAFNWGVGTEGGFPATSVLALVNAGRFDEVPAELVHGRGPPTRRWPHGRPYDKGLAGVRAQRIAEGELFARRSAMAPIDIIRAVAADLERQGVSVEFVPGWEGRGRPYRFEPGGEVVHHTAGPACRLRASAPGAIREAIERAPIAECAAADPELDGKLPPAQLERVWRSNLPKIGPAMQTTESLALRAVVCGSGNYPSLGVVRDGRRDLPGPLAQFGTGRDGTVYVIAAGYANHAGPGGWNGLSGNGSVWGNEMENAGQGGDPWFDEQLRAGKLLSAALARHTGYGPESISMHKEWSSAGKIDPTGIDGDTYRAEVGHLIGGGSSGTNQEDDQMSGPQMIPLPVGERVVLAIPPLGGGSANPGVEELFVTYANTSDEVVGEVELHRWGTGPSGEKVSVPAGRRAGGSIPPGTEAVAVKNSGTVDVGILVEYRMAPYRR